MDDAVAALDGARAILVERFAEDGDLIGVLREQMWSNGLMASTVRNGKKAEGEKFKDYFDFSEPLAKLPSHRILAMFRGEKEEMLDLQILPEPVAATPTAVSSYELKIMQRFAISDQGRPGDKWLTETVRWAWRTKIQVQFNVDLRMRLWTAAEQEAVRVFASNLRDLLLAAPAGARVTMGLDPGFRSGVKVAVVDTTGKVVATTTIYPHEPARRWDEALATLGKLAVQHRVDLIAIGNGTASRETDKLAMDLVKLLPDLKMSKIVVSEAGASVYSASAFASEELPELDVTLRGAVSIARRLQDPRWPNWSRSIRRPSASDNISMTLARANWRARSMRWWRIASTRSESMPTSPRCRCWRGYRGSARGWRKASSSIATPTARSSRARR